MDIWAVILKIIELFFFSSGSSILLSDCKAIYKIHKQVMKTAGLYWHSQLAR